MKTQVQLSRTALLVSLQPPEARLPAAVFNVPQVEILPQGKETIIFKQFFKNWN